MKFINSEALLKEALPLIQKSSWAAVDTEADSLHHYIEKLCLVQISVEGEDLVVDPLVNLDLAPLTKLLSEKFLILHGADFDIRMLKKNSEFNPTRIFDTMIAAQLLGYDKQGLADLVAKHCAVTLSKTEQKADWSRRPLTEKMLTYAINDTHHLRKIQMIMEAELAALGRLDWFRQNCDRLLVSLRETPAVREDSGRRWQIKGSKELKGIALTTLKALWHWREEEAKRRDLPSFKVLNGEYLTQIAQWAEKNPQGDIGNWDKAPRNVKGEHREVINGILRKVSSLPPALFEYPERKAKGKRWTEKDTQNFDRLRSMREKKGLELKIHPSLLATNATLEDIISASPKSAADLEKIPSLMPWQREILAEDLLKITSSV